MVRVTRCHMVLLPISLKDFRLPRLNRQNKAQSHFFYIFISFLAHLYFHSHQYILAPLSMKITGILFISMPVFLYASFQHHLTFLSTIATHPSGYFLHQFWAVLFAPFHVIPKFLRFYFRFSSPQTLFKKTLLKRKLYQRKKFYHKHSLIAGIQSV